MFNINWRQLFVPNYLFARFAPPPSRQFFITWLSGGIGFFVAGILIRIIVSRTKLVPVWARWWRRVGTMLSTMGFLALMFLFFRSEDVPVLSARVWMLAWLIGLVLWTASLVWTAWMDIPHEVATYQDKQRIKKYLPHK